MFDCFKLCDNTNVHDINMREKEERYEVWTLIIEKSTMIPPSLMVLFDVSPRMAIIIQTSLEHNLSQKRV